MTYLWIGIGGALGSMARAWLATAVARITGPQFPWGTILINIVGSFVISFFGTLTANDSRFAGGAELRAFVMVGVCGGFTTFSSFSLQTLELARDGRVAQAAGNVGLSVALCLLAVTAGYASASGLQRTHPTMAAASQRRDAVVLLHRPEDASALIDAGAHVLSLEGGGELRALIVHPPSAPMLPSEEVMTTARAADLRAERADTVAALRQAARTVVEAHGASATLVDVNETSYASLADQAAEARIFVASRPGGDDGDYIHQAVHTALFEAACPVLLLPPGGSHGFGKIVAVAWNDDARALEAVRDAIPLLRAAQAVHVLSADCDARTLPILQQAGIRASLHTLPDSAEPTGERLLAAAHQLGADLLVTGAFAHGAWREGVFGGVTRTMLASADIPLFMRH